MGKTNKVLVVLVIVLSILVLALGGYMIYDKILNNESVGDTNNKENNISKEQTNYNEWMQYILDSDIEKITLNRTRLATIENEEDISKEITLNIEELKEIFKTIYSSNFEKKYTLGMGISDGDVLSISYKINDDVYTFQIANGIIFIETIKDNNLLTLIEDTTYTIQNEELSNEEDSFFVYKYDYDNLIFDTYFE